MTIDSSTRDFIKTYQGQLKKLADEFLRDYLDRVVDEEDAQKREVYVQIVKELRKVRMMIENIGSDKAPKKKPEEQFTGV